MLTWLAGGSKEQQFNDTTFADHPDTPAHVFAARAFKYRLWGTPKPPDTVVQAKERPNSYYYGDDALPGGPALSPSKKNGILMTPGTANPRRSKTVSFGANDGEAKATQRTNTATRNKTAPIVPGKFPTPSRIEMTAFEDIAAAPQTQLTEKLKHARSTSVPTDFNLGATDKPVFGQGNMFSGPSNPSIDWKERYDQYSTRTEREMKRLIAKQQAAKQYARKKDTAASQLAEHLQEERRKITSLESQITALTEEVLRMQNGLVDATALAKADPSRSIDDYNDAVPKPAPLRPRPSKDALTKQPAPSIPRRSSARRPPPPTTEKDIWASTLIITPDHARKSKFEDDIISSHLRRTRQTPPKPVTRPSNDQKRPASNPLRPRDINLESTTPKQTPPPSHRRSTLYSSNSPHRRTPHRTPLRPSARRSRIGLTDAAACRRQADTNKALPPQPAATTKLVDEVGGKDLDASLALPPLPSPEEAGPFSALSQRRHPTFFGGAARHRPAAALPAHESSPFVADAHDRLALPYSLPFPSPKVRTHEAGAARREQLARSSRRAVREEKSRGRRVEGADEAGGRMRGWTEEMGLQATPRGAVMLDAERRAKAAQRIAARRREKAKGSRVA